jgi:hypothetical protein
MRVASFHIGFASEHRVGDAAAANAVRRSSRNKAARPGNQVSMSVPAWKVNE